MKSANCSLILPTVVTLLGTRAAHAQCDPQWIDNPAFGLSSLELGGGEVFDAVVFDDGQGNGPELYVCGSFMTAAGLPVNRIAKWDGERWHDLMGGMNNTVYALTVFDEDGSGPMAPALIAGGSFGNAGGVPLTRIARWNGGGWASVGGSFAGGPHELSGAVTDMVVREESAGPVLYVAGPDTVGSLAVNKIVKWDGKNWSPLSTGLAGGGPAAVAIFDDGDGPVLYVAGNFATAGGVAASNLARWDGSEWSDVEGGTNGYVEALYVYDDGAGEALYVGGAFNVAGGIPAHRVARWDGTSWSGLGIDPNNSRISEVSAFERFDDGSGPALYIGGTFWRVNDVQAASIVKWQDSTFSFAGTLSNSVETLASFDDGAGSQLYAGGNFTNPSKRVAVWNGSAWRAPGKGLNGPIEALVAADDQSAVYAGGRFRRAGDTVLNGVGKWDGKEWSALGTGLNEGAFALELAGEANAPVLYAGGQFTEAGGLPRNRIAKWNGESWEALGTGLGTLGSETVQAIAARNESGLPVIYAGGNFAKTGANTVVNHVAKWDGAQWSPLGPGFNNQVEALVFYDDGSGQGEQLYAGGGFTMSGSTAMRGVAKWNGATWTNLGGNSFVGVRTLLPYYDGASSFLLAGGQFSSIGGVPATNVARWNGAVWSPIGGGLSGGGVSTLHVAQNPDGNAQTLYAGGWFDQGFVRRIAQWNGSAWVSLGTGIDMSIFDGGTPAVTVNAIAGVTVDQGSKLCVGGVFFNAGGAVSHCFAEWLEPQPQLTSHPEDNNSLEGDELTLTVSAIGWDPLDFQWRKDNVDLADDGRITGSSTSQLTITALQLEDAGLYDVVVTNECGQATSDAASIGVFPACSADIEPRGGDQHVGLGDLLLLIARWGECIDKCPPYCVGDIDQNCVINVVDLLIVVESWGQCSQ